MNRKELLELSLNEDKNGTNLVEITLNGDKRFIKRAKRDLEDSIEDLEVELKQRLSANSPIDKSVIEVTFASIKTRKELLELYKGFEKEYL